MCLGIGDLELIVANLGDLLGAGRTVEAADLVVTPERVESAIHNTDATGTAREDIRTTLDVYSKAEVDDAIADTGDTSTLSTARLQYTRRMIAGIDTVLLEEVESPNHEVLRYERVVNGDSVTWDLVMSGNVRAG